jgi:hypothetical protein
MAKKEDVSDFVTPAKMLAKETSLTNPTNVTAQTKTPIANVPADSHQVLTVYESKLNSTVEDHHQQS